MRRSIDDHNLLLSIENASEIAAKAGHGDPTSEEMEAVRKAQPDIIEQTREHVEQAIDALGSIPASGLISENVGVFWRDRASIKERARKRLLETLAAIDRRNPGTPPTKLPEVVR